VGRNLSHAKIGVFTMQLKAVCAKSINNLCAANKGFRHAAEKFTLLAVMRLKAFSRDK